MAYGSLKKGKMRDWETNWFKHFNVQT